MPDNTPCSTCAFRDPETWVADKMIPSKILDCLQQPGQQFYCHKGCPVEQNAYQPPRLTDGTIDTSQLTPCSGFRQWARKWDSKPPAAQQREVFRLQRHFLTQYIRHSQVDFAVTCRKAGYSAADLAMALNLMAEGQHAGQIRLVEEA